MQVLPRPSFGVSASTTTKSSGDRAQKAAAKEMAKNRKGMSILYQTLEYQELASTIPYFILSRMTHRLISYVNSCGIAGSENPDDKSRYSNYDGSFKNPKLDLQELHVIFRENY